MSVTAPLVITLLCCLSTLSAVDATQAVPKPPASATVPALDADTLSRANAAADAFAKADAAAHPPPSQAAVDAMAAAEVNLLEAKTYLDQGDVTHAGDCYLAARKQLTDLPAADRPLLGARLVAARDAVADLSQRMLAADHRSLSEFPATGADAGATAAAPAVTDH